MTNLNLLLSSVFIILSLFFPSNAAFCIEKLTDIFDLKEIVKEYTVGGYKYKINIFEDNDDSSAFFGTKFIIIHIPKNNSTINIIEIRKDGDSKAVFDGISSNNDIIIVYGGFFGTTNSNKNTPLGLVISNGNVVNNPIRWKSGGVACVYRNNKFEILEILNFQLNTNLREAIQSKPIVVNKGKNDIYTDAKDRFNRTAIGTDIDNNIVVAGVFNHMGSGASLYEFGQLLENYSKLQSNIKIWNMLAMDGGPGACILIPRLKYFVGHTGNNYIPNAIKISNTARH